MKKVIPPVNPRRIFSLLLILIVASILGCYGINNTKNLTTKTGRRKPNMWVDKGRSNKYEGNFNLQHYILSQHLPGDETDSLFYPIDSFKKLIDTLRIKYQFDFLHVYIVAYDKKSDVKKELQGKLTLMFSPAKSLNSDGPPFYLFDSTGRFVVDPNYKRWRDEFRDHKLPYLKDDLDSTDTANYSHKLMFSDTRRISYSRKNIDSLMSEIAYQDSVNNTHISGLRAMFASYSISGHPYYPKNFKNRIFVIYELTRKDSKNQMDSVFYIDDQPDFPNRLEPLDPAGMEDLDTAKIKGVDNGHLCPPNCP